MNAFTAIGLCFLFSVAATAIAYIVDSFTSLDEHAPHLAIMQYAVLFFMFFVVSVMMALIILV